MAKNDSVSSVISVISVWQVGIGGYSLGNTAIQYHNCILEDMFVVQIALTLSVQMIKTTLLSV